MEFFESVLDIRTEGDLQKKYALIGALQEATQNSSPIRFAHDAKVISIVDPTYAARCKIVPGSQVERRRNLGTREGRGIFLHALAHIEYSAIDLAFDSLYRFRHLPPQYYEDFLRVALDEARHFQMLRSLLQEIDYDYGSFNVHTGIHDAMVRSQDSLRRRMAATHRHLEAGGLDAHPELARKFAEFSDPFAAKISAALKVIFDDEITHVYCGDFWFRSACSIDGVGSEAYAGDVSAAIPGAKLLKKNLNHDARRRAGFTATELLELEAR